MARLDAGRSARAVAGRDRAMVSHAAYRGDPWRRNFSGFAVPDERGIAGYSVAPSRSDRRAGGPRQCQPRSASLRLGGAVVTLLAPAAGALRRQRAVLRQRLIHHRVDQPNPAPFGALAIDDRRSAYPLLALARACKGGHDTVQGAQFLLGALGALEQAAQVVHHARPAFAIAQKSVFLERLFEMVEEIEELLLGRRPASAAVQDLRRCLDT